ncbi:MAG: rod-binding protein [Treponema sp.]|nr:rod-binding protein [Treponema sp.]
MTVSGIGSGFSSVTSGVEAMHATQISGEHSKFEDMVKSLKAEQEAVKSSSTINVSSSQILEEGRLTGDYRTSFSGTYTSEADKKALPMGAAANSAKIVDQKPIDRTSKLYEKSMELESFFVKQMLSAMRKTIVHTQENNYAQNMYEDMLYDEYATSMTKNAHFGLADMIYQQLS